MPNSVRPLRLILPWKTVTIPSSTATYWVLDADTVMAQRCQVSSQEPTIPIFREPHVAVVGTVSQVISEADGDRHVWLALDGTTKQLLACELTPQGEMLPATDPIPGQHILVAGIWRWDDRHGWWEIHPVDHWQPWPVS